MRLPKWRHLGVHSPVLVPLRECKAQGYAVVVLTLGQLYGDVPTEIHAYKWAEMMSIDELEPSLRGQTYDGLSPQGWIVVAKIAGDGVARRHVRQ